MSETDKSRDRILSYATSLENLHRRRIEIDHQIYRLVMASHSEGATWREIGFALGISPQAAWERFRPATPPKTRGV